MAIKAVNSWQSSHQTNSLHPNFKAVLSAKVVSKIKSAPAEINIYRLEKADNCRRKEKVFYTKIKRTMLKTF